MNKIRVELHKNLALINDEKESYAGISRHQNPRNSWCTFIQRELTSRYLKEQYFISRTKLEGVGISQVPRPYQLTFIPTCAMQPDPFFSAIMTSFVSLFNQMQECSKACYQLVSSSCDHRSQYVLILLIITVRYNSFFVQSPNPGSFPEK